MSRLMQRSYAAIALFLVFAGCGGAPPTSRVDAASYVKDPEFSSFAGKRVAILGFDDAVASSVPSALVLRPGAPRPGETQRDAALRRLADFRHLGELFAPEARDEWSGTRAARSELFHHAFAGALLTKGVTLVERERIARVLGELRLNGEDDPVLTPEARLATHNVELFGCDYVIVGNPLADAVEYDYVVRASSLPLCVLLAPIAMLVSESADLAAARAAGHLAIANPVFHDVRVRQTLGMSIRVIEVATGKIVWIGSATAVADQPSGISGLLAQSADEPAAIAETRALETLAAEMVASLTTGGVR
jgi:hypothetical protein